MKRIFLETLMVVLLLAPRAHAISTWYVDDDRPDDTGSGTGWSTAFHTIQAAVDAASSGDTVVVKDGLYNIGSRVAPDQILCGNRVVVDKDITLQSLNGAAVTTIRGSGPRGDSAVRGVWMTDGATLDGFTVENGFTAQLGGALKDDDGGGVFCSSLASEIRNCIITGNSARYGGGVHSGTLTNCTLSGNSAAYGGGSYYSSLENCTLSGNSAQSGGASYFGTLDNCVLSKNSASSGGGTHSGTLHNCTLSLNTASYAGGGAYYGTLDNCSLSDNSATSFGGGAYYGTLNNCLLTGNSAVSFGGGAYSSTMNNCTLTENTASASGGARNGTLKNCIIYNNGGGNVDGCALSMCYTNNPFFVDAANSNFRLSLSSPCVNTGLNAFAPAFPGDLDGNIRIVNGTIDIGAYEYQGGDLHFITVTTGGHGSISPSGLVNVLAGSDRIFTFVPNPFYQVGDVRTNGTSLGLAGVSSFTWQNTQADGTLAVDFEALATQNNVPLWWLAQYGWTDNFDVAALSDTDHDGYAAWEEYVMEADPTDPLSNLDFRGSAAGNAARLNFTTVAGRMYTIETTDSLVGGPWREYMSFGGIGGEVGINCYNLVSNLFFRVKVDLIQ